MRPGWLGPTAVCAAGLCAASLAVAQDAELGQEFENLRRALVERRAAVDTLATRVADAQDAASTVRRGLRTTQANLDTQVRHADTRARELHEQIQRVEASIAEKRAARASLAPLAERQIAALRAAIQASIPFRTAERLAECDALLAELRAGKAPADQVLARTWSAVEDELRLARENGFHRDDAITVDGVRQLADLVRIGTLAMYCRTQDGRVGMVVRDGTGWAWRRVEDEAGVAQVRALFDGFERRVKSGYFPVPNPEAR